MQQPAPRTRTVFRACVVNAVREGEALMTQLVQVTRGALTSQESELRDIARRNLASDALRLLNQHEAALVKAYDARFGVGAWRRDAAKPPAEARLTSLQVSLPRSPEAIDPEVSAMMYSVGPVLGPAGLTDPATYAAIYADAFAEVARLHAEGHAIAGLRITMLSTGIYAARVADPPALFAQAAACIVDGLLAATRAHPELAKVIVLINTEAHPSSKERVAFARAAKARGLQFDSSGFSVPLA